MPDKAKRYIELISQQGKRLMVPAPVIHEFLIGVPAEERVEVISRLSNIFFIPPFDLPSAILAAELHTDRQEFNEIRKTLGKTKQEAKIDTQIIAIALMNGAEEIITNDVKYYQAIASDRIRVSSIPDIQSQETLPL